ncbi:hypothetical protein M758_5G012500 [Ceratodon purpureus]|nr:hypothetical protein M758_5G012500 [Ceratodon purpureus]
MACCFFEACLNKPTTPSLSLSCLFLPFFLLARHSPVVCESSAPTLRPSWAPIVPNPSTNPPRPRKFHSASQLPCLAFSGLRLPRRSPESGIWDSGDLGFGSRDFVDLAELGGCRVRVLRGCVGELRSELPDRCLIATGV